MYVKLLNWSPREKIRTAWPIRLLWRVRNSLPLPNP
jgi:hypothetical protein